MWSLKGYETKNNNSLKTTSTFVACQSWILAIPRCLYQLLVYSTPRAHTKKNDRENVV